MKNKIKIAVIIPAYKVKKHILEVIALIGPEVDSIYVVDDACPDCSGKFVEVNALDKRIQIIYHEFNQGVGGAVMTGYQKALKDGMEILVKVDGDGQMNPKLIPSLIRPIIMNNADYTKGNRFYNIECLSNMPFIRLIGNAALSFINKVSSGYWNIFDPTNGFTAIHSVAANLLPLKKISKRYFFESDVLFRLNTFGATVVDVPMDAIYGNEVSNLKIRVIFLDFIKKHLINFCKRIFYNYYLRDMSVASFELPLGLFLIIFGLFYGGYYWHISLTENISTPVGTIILSALSLMVGTQFLLAFVSYDISRVPTQSLQTRKI